MYRTSRRERDQTLKDDDDDDGDNGDQTAAATKTAHTVSREINFSNLDNSFNVSNGMLKMFREI